jgi:hypothetical protein
MHAYIVVSLMAGVRTEGARALIRLHHERWEHEECHQQGKGRQA